MSRPALPDNLIKKIQDVSDRLTRLEFSNQGAELPTGLLANRPNADAVRPGFEYYATDVDGGTLYKAQGGVWLAVSRYTSPQPTIPTYLGDQYIYPQGGGWWNQGGGNGGIVNNSSFQELTNSSGALNSRIIMPNLSVQTTWEPYMQLLVRADSSNWTPLHMQCNYMNAGGTTLAYWGSLSNSNQGRGNGVVDDWVTMSIRGTPFSHAANASGYFLVPYIRTIGSYGGLYNRDYIYNNFMVRRIA